jgi:hypothetical protein
MSISEKKQARSLPSSERQVRQPRFVWFRLLFVFISGVFGGLIHILFAFYGYPILISIFIDPQDIWFAVPLAIAIPLSMGLAAPFIVGRRGNAVIPLGIGASILAWVGMAFSLSIWAGQPEEMAKWAGISVLLYLFGSFVLMVFSGLITGLVLKLVQKSHPATKRFV